MEKPGMARVYRRGEFRCMTISRGGELTDTDHIGVDPASFGALFTW